MFCLIFLWMKEAAPLCWYRLSHYNRKRFWQICFKATAASRYLRYLLPDKTKDHIKEAYKQGMKAIALSCHCFPATAIQWYTASEFGGSNGHQDQLWLIEWSCRSLSNPLLKSSELVATLMAEISIIKHSLKNYLLSSVLNWLQSVSFLSILHIMHNFRNLCHARTESSFFPTLKSFQCFSLSS